MKMKLKHIFNGNKMGKIIMCVTDELSSFDVTRNFGVNLFLAFVEIWVRIGSIQLDSIASYLTTKQLN